MSTLQAWASLLPYVIGGAVTIFFGTVWFVLVIFAWLGVPFLPASRLTVIWAKEGERDRSYLVLLHTLADRKSSEDVANQLLRIARQYGVQATSEWDEMEGTGQLG